MVFPYDVQGTYKAPERDIGSSQQTPYLRSVTAVVTHDTIVFREVPQDDGSQDIEVYSKKYRPHWLPRTTGDNAEGSCQD